MVCFSPFYFHKKTPYAIGQAGKEYLSYGLPESFMPEWSLKSRVSVGSRPTHWPKYVLWWSAEVYLVLFGSV